MSLMYTQSGRVIDPLNFRASDIDLTDIAHALSMICRYGGHTNRFYSVAEHCVRLAKYMADHNPPLCKAALLHDSAEAYVGDMIQPIKGEFVIYEIQIELPVLQKIGEVFGVPMAEFQLVKPFDKRILVNEMRQLMPKVCDSLSDLSPLELPQGPFGWSPTKAKQEFLSAAMSVGIYE